MGLPDRGECPLNPAAHRAASRSENRLQGITLKYTTGQWHLGQDQDASKPHESSQPRGPVLCYHHWTPDSAPVATILLVHGLGEHAKRYAPVAETMVRKGFAVVGYDQSGHGLTGGPLPDFETLLRDLDRVARKLHSERVTLTHPRHEILLYGQSLGGALVLRYALDHPAHIAGVVASSPLIRTAVPPPQWKIWIGQTLGRFFPQLSLGTAVGSDQLSRIPEAQVRYRNDPLIHQRVSAVLALSMLKAGEWVGEHAEQLRIPTLVMHGTADSITSHHASIEFAQQAQNVCSLKLWPGGLHDLHFDAEQEKVLDHAGNFLMSLLNDV